VILAFTLYVDDALIAGREDVVKEFKKYLESIYTLRDWMPLSKMLSINYKVHKDLHERHMHRVTSEMTDYAKVAVEVYFEEHRRLTKEKKPAPSAKYNAPCVGPESKKAGDKPGVHAENAMKYAGKWLYLTRTTAPECAYATGEMARHSHKWTDVQDQAIERLAGYTAKHIAGMVGGREPTMRIDHVNSKDKGKVKLQMRCDADYGGDPEKRRSTTGFTLHLMGENGTFMLLDWGSQLQQCITISTAEAEMIATRNSAKHLFGALPVMETLFGKDLKVEIKSDSQASIQAIKLGRSQNLKFIKKVYDISLKWLSEYVGPYVSHIVGPANSADALSKGLSLNSFEYHKRYGYGIVPKSHAELPRCIGACKDFEGKTQRCLGVVLKQNSKSMKCTECLKGHEKCPCHGHNAPDVKESAKKLKEKKRAEAEEAKDAITDVGDDEDEEADSNQAVKDSVTQEAVMLMMSDHDYKNQVRSNIRRSRRQRLDPKSKNIRFGQTSFIDLPIRIGMLTIVNEEKRKSRLERTLETEDGKAVVRVYETTTLLTKMSAFRNWKKSIKSYKKDYQILCKTLLEEFRAYPYNPNKPSLYTVRNVMERIKGSATMTGIAIYLGGDVKASAMRGWYLICDHCGVHSANVKFECKHFVMCKQCFDARQPTLCGYCGLPVDEERVEVQAAMGHETVSKITKDVKIALARAWDEYRHRTGIGNKENVVNEPIKGKDKMDDDDYDLLSASMDESPRSFSSDDRLNPKVVITQ